MLKQIKEVLGATWRVLFHVDKPKPVESRLTADEIAENYAILSKEKEEATKAGEPWVAVLGMDVDYENLADGNFELDWNEIFIAKLVRAGYQGKEDADLVDQWFNNVCRNIVLETYEQAKADPVQSRKLDGGRKEYR